MRITYRDIGNKDYWAKRWADIPADQPMDNADKYPLKYALLTVNEKDGKILEAGCGAGRIVRYFNDRGYDIIGIDFIEEAIRKLKAEDPKVQAEAGDITNLQFKDDMFKYILAFGLYHNLEHGLNKAIAETFRVLKKGGSVCASFRADNVQTKLNDWVANYRGSHGKKDKKQFHKVNLTRAECVDLFERGGFQIENVFRAENMPILYKFAFFRAKDHKKFDENKARMEGYKLSFVGNLITKALMKLFPDQFCNLYVIIAEKI